MGLHDQETAIWRLVQKVSLVSNALENLIPIGTLYLTHLPRLLSQDSKAPDGWKWVDLPYMEDSELISLTNEKSSFTALLSNLQYLTHRAYIKLTYKLIHSDLACVRVYVVPSDIRDATYLNEYRARFRHGKSLAWHESRYKKIMTNLLMVLDYDVRSWNGDLNGKEMIIFMCLQSYRAFDTKVVGSDFLGKPNQQIFNFHIQRLLKRDSFKDFKQELREVDLETKLLELYNSIKSPEFDLSSSCIKFEQKELILDILNNEINGLQSSLYSYQRQSVAKMLEKEFYPQRMTTFLQFADGAYLDITTLKFHNSPEIFVTPRGGVLAENMGLGKTFICLALICCSKFEISQVPEAFTAHRKPASALGQKVPSLMRLCIKKLNDESIVWKSYQNQLSDSCFKALQDNPGSFVVPLEEDLTRRRSNRISTSVEITDSGRKLYLCSTTLVITPDNLFHQWLIEIKKHLKKDFLKILKIHGLNIEIPRAQELIKYDLILITNSAFAKQTEIIESPLKYVYWKRLIIDEGHSMNSKLSRSSYMIQNLSVERKWTISGTPTAGLTRLHMNEEVEDEPVLNSPKKKKHYVVKRNFDVHQDLRKLGVLISSFFQIDPWYRDDKLWTKQIVKPFVQDLFGADLQLQKILSSILVRHELEDVERHVQLPPLHHKTVFLNPSFHDKISLNLFTAVLATNAVTSERRDQDYMFHPSNRSELRRLVTNLQKATFYWTGFTINDMEVLISICELAKKKKYASGKSYYSNRDIELLDKSIQSAKLALRNPRWRTASAIHEMSYFIKNLPTPFTRSLSTGVVNSEVSTYGAPQLSSAQAFFYKNRFLRDLPKLIWKLEEHIRPFWSNYWKTSEQKNIQRSKNRDGQSIDSYSVSEALQTRHERNEKKRKHEQEEQISTTTTAQPQTPSTPPPAKKAMKTSTKIAIISPRQMLQSEDGGIKTTNDNLISIDHDQELIQNIKKAKILGTASQKLSYLASRLLEHQLSGVKSIVFFEFEESAYYLTELLDLMGVNYLMYATFIKLNQRWANLSEFTMHTGEGVTLIMDLKLASHGLTIISATRVYFINPIWKMAVEAQAIKRAHRIGQTEEVFVETLILKDTIEEEMFRKRLNYDKKPEKDVEAATLIDDTGMQEFISRHIFLAQDQEEDSEICDFQAPISTEEEKLCANDNGEDDDDEALLKASGVRLGQMRKWDIPLFSEANMIRQNDHLQKKRLTDSTNNDEGVQNGEEEEVDDEVSKRQERINFAKTLRQERIARKKVRFV